jgi:hypothetical protein
MTESCLKCARYPTCETLCPEVEAQLPAENAGRSGYEVPMPKNMTNDAPDLRLGRQVVYKLLDGLLADYGQYLSPDQRRIAVLMWTDGLNMSQIARIMGLSHTEIRRERDKIASTLLCASRRN